MRSLMTALILGLPLAAPAFADVKQGQKVIDCFCTDKSGLRVELGENICLQVDGRAFIARCEMSLNVPMWRDTGEGCLSSQAKPAPNMTPIPTAG